jgi:hypothetical protein
MKWRTKEQYKEWWNTELDHWKDKQDWQTLRQTNQKKEKTQSNKIRDARKDITANITEIQRIIMEYLENLHSKKL